ncbi:MAG TPA: sigma-70 family RNA polymerase sigma factor [Nitrospiraceae bacterium]|nr:sigma-70 family RNA polymerase sigma factor [Nitrospiraceae bacterium]
MAHDDTLSWVSAFARHHDALLRFFIRKLGCRDIAADCAQETYVHLVRMGSSVPVQNPRAFLFRVATNLAIDYLRKSRTRGTVFSIDPPPEDAPSTAPSAEDVIEAKQRVVRLESAIKELSVKCRTALLLNRLEGKTHADIARTLGVSESMVAKYIVQALKHCRARLQQEP